MICCYNVSKNYIVRSYKAGFMKDLYLLVGCAIISENKCPIPHGLEYCFNSLTNESTNADKLEQQSSVHLCKATT